MHIRLSLLAVVAALLVPAGAEASSLKDCGQVNARNGGKARSIQATGGTKPGTGRGIGFFYKGP